MPPEGQELETVDDELELESGTPPEADDVDDPDVDGTPPDDVDEESPEDKNWASLRQKYPGLSDEEINRKVYASYWEQTRAISSSEKQKRELELRLARLEGRIEAGQPPAAKEPPPPPPEVQELDAYISSLEQRDSQVAESQTKLLGELSTAKDKVSEIRGQIAAAKAAQDEDRVDRLESRLETAEDRVANTRDKLDRTVQSRKDIAWNHARAKKERAWVERVIAEGQAREESERQELEEALEAIPEVVDDVITKAITDAKVPANEALRDHIRATVRDKVTVDMWKAGDKVPFNKMNVPKLVRGHIDDYMKANGLAKRSSFVDQSRRKTAVSGGQPPPAVETPKGGRKPARVVSGTGALSAGMLRGRRLLEKKGW
jgi:hypothetical protein